MSQRTVQNCCYENFVKFLPILIICGKKVAKRLKFCKVQILHIALLFSAMTVHGIVFDDLLVSSIIPIPKAKNINCTESTYYRGIALSSIFGKILDRIILSRYADKLITSQYQFG